MNRWHIDPSYFPVSLILKNQKPLFLLLWNQELIATLLDKLLGKLLWITRTNWSSTQTVWSLLEGTILIGWYRNGNRKNHPPTCKLRAGGFALCDRKSYECLSASFPAFYLVVSRKKRNFAAKLDVEL